MSLTLTTAPAAEPVAVSELRERLDITSTDRDTELTALLLSARQLCEEYTWSQFITATWTLTLDHFTNEIRLPRGPVQSVSSIKYLDLDGTLQTLSPSSYQVVIGSSPFVCRAYNTLWPSTRSQPEAVRVEFVSGFGDASSDVPEPIRQAIIVTAAAAYHGCNEMTNAAKGLLAPYRLIDARVTACLA